jgi:predicted RNase H-like HicB family nuclease
VTVLYLAVSFDGNRPSEFEQLPFPANSRRDDTKNAVRAPRQSAGILKRYSIVIEETGSGYAAYSPDLPGCVSATGPRLEIEKNIKEAVAFHLAGLREEGQAIPEAHTFSTYIDLPAEKF